MPEQVVNFEEDRYPSGRVRGLIAANLKRQAAFDAQIAGAVRVIRAERLAMIQCETEGVRRLLPAPESRLELARTRMPSPRAVMRRVGCGDGGREYRRVREALKRLSEAEALKREAGTKSELPHR